MNKDAQEYPYKMLGLRLKSLRQRLQESVAEVSGAVEIDADMLLAIERGSQRPSEDILMLLISHFSAKEEEASRLWRLAGYDPKMMDDDSNMASDDHGSRPVMVMPMDLRIVYTDMVHVMVNDYGLVMNFMQGGGPGNQPLAIARVGMSREHAKSVLEVLQKTLTQSEPKQLPGGRDSKSDAKA